jgi:nucleotide-binding universal stress UspA family protein
MAARWMNGQLRRILVGYDGSIDSERALETALALGKCTESELLVLSVVRPPEPAPLRRANPLEGASKQLERTLTRLRRRMQRKGIEIETQVVLGHPAEEILRTAREVQVDLIVVGQQGISRHKELTLGSIAQHVLSHAPCPVTVTK